MLDYLDFWYVHRPLSHAQSFKLTNLQYCKNGLLDCHDFPHQDRSQEFQRLANQYFL